VQKADEVAICFFIQINIDAVMDQVKITAAWMQIGRDTAKRVIGGRYE